MWRGRPLRAWLLRSLPLSRPPKGTRFRRHVRSTHQRRHDHSRQHRCHLRYPWNQKIRNEPFLAKQGNLKEENQPFPTRWAKIINVKPPYNDSTCIWIERGTGLMRCQVKIPISCDKAMTTDSCLRCLALHTTLHRFPNFRSAFLSCGAFAKKYVKHTWTCWDHFILFCLVFVFFSAFSLLFPICFISFLLLTRVAEGISMEAHGSKILHRLLSASGHSAWSLACLCSRTASEAVMRSRHSEFVAWKELSNL